MNEHLSALWRSRLKWVKESKLHLTWLFLGDMQNERITELSQRISQLIESRNQQIESALIYDCLELWGRRGAPRNLVLTPQDADQSFLNFVKIARKELSEFASTEVVHQANTDWKPHITLLRLPDATKTLPAITKISSNKSHRSSKGKELPASIITGLADLLPLNHAIDSVSLIESKEEDGSHKYNALETFLLI